MNLFEHSFVALIIAANPKGIVSSSLGLRGTSYPRFGKGERPNRNAVASRSSQPWASRWNPVGIHLWLTSLSSHSLEHTYENNAKRVSDRTHLRGDFTRRV